MYEFPYFKERPRIPIRLEHRDVKKRFLPLLDSGSDLSIFYKSDAVRMGLDWKSGQSRTFQNADGSSFEGYELDVKMVIEEEKLTARICFIDDYADSKPLLGRQDVFRHFKIEIDERAQRVSFSPHLNSR